MKTSGRIKAGEGTLIGNAGEYYVMAELLKQGIVAALAPRNAPAFDIMATKEGKTVRIRVKTKSEGYEVWQWAVKKDGSIFRQLAEKGDFTVLVNLTENAHDLEFFIMPTYIVNGWLMAIHEKWRNTPGKKGRERSTTNPKRHLNRKQFAEQIEKYLDTWDILWQE